MLRAIVHFVLIGAALFAAERTIAPAWIAPAAREPLVVGAEQVAALRRAWTADTGREPDDRAVAALVGQVVDEEVLVQTALRLGIDTIDPVVWHRLVENMRFVARDHERSDGDLYAEARTLGMERSDLVVRRRLVERMRQGLRQLGRSVEPTDAELEDYIARHPEQFTEPARVTFSQIFLSRQRRGARLQDDAAALAASLAAPAAGAVTQTATGDRSLFPGRYALVTERDIGKDLGTELAAAVMRMAPGRWLGPVASPYGLHFVLVHEIRLPARRPLAAVRARARHGLLRERQEQAFTEGLHELRGRFQVDVAS